MTHAYAVFDKNNKLSAVYLNERSARSSVKGTSDFVVICKLDADGCHIVADHRRIVPDDVLVPESDGSGGPGR